MSQSALKMMIALRSEIEARLQVTEDYRALKALELAISQMEGAAVDPQRQRVRTQSAKTDKGVSQGDAAALALEEYGSPASTPELLELARMKGAKIGGADPLINMASSLSRDERFKSVKVGGKSMWWFADREIPPLINQKSLFRGTEDDDDFEDL